MKLSYWSLSAAIILVAALCYRFVPSGTSPDNRPAVESKDLTPARLLSRIYSGNEQMLTAGERFGDSVIAAMTQERLDDGALDKTHREALAAIRVVRNEFQTSIPPDSQSGRQLHAAYKQYLQWQEKIYVEDYAQIVRSFNDPNSSALERQNIVTSVFLKRSEDEATKNRELEKFRSALQREHGLEISRHGSSAK